MEFWKKPINRRKATKIILSSATPFFIKGCGGLPKPSIITKQASSSPLDLISPIDRSVDSVAPRKWFGDNPQRAHKYLWNIPKSNQSPTEEVPLVIVGGGMSGLVSAYLLRQYNPIILEQADRFGGNAKGQTYGGAEYSIGAAYFTVPDKGTEVEKLMRELGIHKDWRVSNEDYNVYITPDKKPHRHFWDGATDPKKKSQFLKLKKFFTDVCNEENGQLYPDFSNSSASMSKLLKNLDAQNFQSFLEKKNGGKLHPHIHHALEFYCWTSLGCGLDEISAAAGLNFYASEFGDIAVCPGGNSWVAEKIVKKLAQEISLANLRTSSLVYNVQANDTGVNVSYIDASGKPKTIRAKSVIMSCPKFICKKIIKNLEPKRRWAIEKMQYKTFLTANAIVKGKPKIKNVYETFLLNNPNLDFDDKEECSTKQGVTDLTLANFSNNSENESILTLYRPLPYSGARAEILEPESYEIFRKSFENQLENFILPSFGLNPKNLIDIRMTRWGHPIPVCLPGLYSEGIFDIIRKPFRKRVFFVEQDNWALPSIETAMGEAMTFAPEVKKILS